MVEDISTHLYKIKEIKMYTRAYIILMDCPETPTEKFAEYPDLIRRIPIYWVDLTVTQPFTTEINENAATTETVRITLPAGKNRITHVKCMGFNGLTDSLSSIKFRAVGTYPLCSFYLKHSPITTLDMSLCTTREMTDMHEMFYGCSELISLDISNFTTVNVVDMSRLFADCRKLPELDLSDWDTSNVTNMENMFYYCTALTSVGDLSNWNTNNVTNMRGLFVGCKSLTSLDLTNWDTSNVTDMRYMINSCTNLTAVGDLSNWDTSNVTDLGCMFLGDESLTSLNISNWNTSKALRIDSMFYNCTSIMSLNLSNWDTSNVQWMNDMFSNCISLTSLDVSSFDLSSVTYAQDIFDYCPKLTTIKFGEGWGKAKAAITLNLSSVGVLDQESWNSMLNMYDRVENGLTTTYKIKFNSSVNVPTEEWLELMTKRGYTIV